MHLIFIFMMVPIALRNFAFFKKNILRKKWETLNPNTEVIRLQMTGVVNAGLLFPGATFQNNDVLELVGQENNGPRL